MQKCRGILEDNWQEEAPVRCHVAHCGGWKLPGISGEYPQVSGVSIPQISSYIHVTPPYMCVRGVLNVYLTW